MNHRQTHIYWIHFCVQSQSECVLFDNSDGQLGSVKVRRIGLDDNHANTQIDDCGSDAQIGSITITVDGSVVWKFGNVARYKYVLDNFTCVVLFLHEPDINHVGFHFDQHHCIIVPLELVFGQCEHIYIHIFPWPNFVDVNSPYIAVTVHCTTLNGNGGYVHVHVLLTDCVWCGVRARRDTTALWITSCSSIIIRLWSPGFIARDVTVTGGRHLVAW